jgi:hypothetical protein
MPQGRPGQRRSPGGASPVLGLLTAPQVAGLESLATGLAQPEAASIDDRGWEAEPPLAGMARIEACYFSPDTSCGQMEQSS